MRNSILDELIGPAWRSFWQYVATHRRQVLTVIVWLPGVILRGALENWRKQEESHDR